MHDLAKRARPGPVEVSVSRSSSLELQTPSNLLRVLFRELVRESEDVADVLR